jgi:hypothetical protein
MEHDDAAARPFRDAHIGSCGLGADGQLIEVSHGSCILPGIALESDSRPT